MEAFGRDCPREETPQFLCRWCGLGDYNDANCLKSRVNLLNIERDGTEAGVFAVTRRQVKKVTVGYFAPIGSYPSKSQKTLAI